MDPSYDNSSGGFGSGGMQLAPIATNPGDVVLNNKKSSSKKTGLVIGLIVLVMIVAVAIVAVAIMGFGGGRKTDSLVNEYLNLFAIGEEKNEILSAEQLSEPLIASGEYNNIYTIPRMGDPLSAENVEYYNKLLDLLGKTEEAIKGDKKYNSEDKDAIIALVQDSKNMLPYYFVASALSYTNADYDYYMENNNLNGFLSLYGFPFAEPEDGTISYVDALYEGRREFYDEVAKIGCIAEGMINYECVDELDIDSVQEMRLRNFKLNEQVAGYTEFLFGILITNAQDMNEIFNGVSDE